MTQPQLFKLMEEERYKRKMTLTDFVRSMNISHNTYVYAIAHGNANIKTLTAVMKLLRSIGYEVGFVEIQDGMKLS